jgi:hypothetical protein
VATRLALVFFTSRLTAIRARSRRSLLNVLFSAHPLRCSALGGAFASADDFDVVRARVHALTLEYGATKVRV